MDNSQYILDLAFTAKSFGFVPIPLRGKIPLVSEWQRTTMQNAMEQIERVLNRTDAIGILTGSISDLTVVDIEASALPIWNKLIEQYGDPKTFKIQTGGGGFHYYFKFDPEVLTTNKARGLPIDVRSNGGQVVFPGSRHAITGRLYLVAGGYDNYTPQITYIPLWLKNLLLGK